MIHPPPRFQLPRLSICFSKTYATNMPLQTQNKYKDDKIDGFDKILEEVNMK